MKLYLIRHGETEWNKQGRLQGRVNIPLDDIGRRQAEELRDELMSVELDLCISSPLRRARETAEIVTNGKCNIVFDDRIVERDFGEYEGMLISDWRGKIGDVDTWDIKLNWGEKGFEPAKRVLERSKEFLESIREEYPDDYRIAIVAHGSLLKALHYNIVGYTDETDFHEFYFKNAEMREYDL